MILSNKEIEKMTISEQKEYYERLRKECLLLKNNQMSVGQELIHQLYPLFRSYQLEIEGEENIPKDSKVIFVINHSNSHDIFTAYEVLSALQRKGSVMVATDCLNPVTEGIFNVSNATLLDRRKKEDRENSIMMLSKKILSGYDGVIFGESTWNLHPTLPMHHIKLGPSKISAITQVPIIPTIFEYVEKDGKFHSESQLYKKCIIRFGKPYMINFDDSFIHQTEEIRDDMSDIRKKIWSDYAIVKDSISDIDSDQYVNHTYLKKFKAFGFTYNSEREQEYLLFLNGEPVENEYHINSEGEFVPGFTQKSLRKKR